METPTRIRLLLRKGDRRTIGHVSDVVEAVSREPRLISTLIDCLFEAEEGTRMRAADALEKISLRQVPDLQPFTSALLGLFEESEQQEIRWHLAVTLPRLRLNANERSRTVHTLQQCLTAKSSIVKTSALQGLADMIAQENALKPHVVDLLRSAERSGTAAMKARSRKLLKLLE